MPKTFEVVAYRGKLTNASAFADRLRDRGEITTQDKLDDASVALYSVKTIDYRKSDIRDGLTGIGKGEVVVIKKSDLTALGGTIARDAQTNFPNHALLSDIDAEDCFKAFKKSGVHIDYA